MEHNDYILREIEKIGYVLRSIINSFLKNQTQTAITIGKQFEETNNALLKKLNFNIEEFVNMDLETSNKYLMSLIGFNTENIELLAIIIKDISSKKETVNKKKYLHKSLQLYLLCRSIDKSYSFEREHSIKEIEKALFYS